MERRQPLAGDIRGTAGVEAGNPARGGNRALRAEGLALVGGDSTGGLVYNEDWHAIAEYGPASITESAREAGTHVIGVALGALQLLYGLNLDLLAGASRALELDDGALRPGKLQRVHAVADLTHEVVGGRVGAR